MTLPLGKPVTEHWYQTLVTDTLNLQSYCLLVQSGTASGATVSANTVLAMAGAAVTLKNDITFLGTQPTLVTSLITYFQQQLGAPSLNASTEFTTLSTLATNLLNAFATDYPHDGSNRLLDRTFNFNTGLVWITATAAQMPNIMPAITAFLAEIV